jgi:hypothetical protein
MNSTEEIRLCEQDLREAEDKATQARNRIAYLRGEGPWFGKPETGPARPPSTILFAVEPVRVVEATDDPLTYIDGQRPPQTHDYRAEITEGGIRAAIIYSGRNDGPDAEDAAAVKSILRAVLAEREACAKIAESEPVAFMDAGGTWALARAMADAIRGRG